MIVGVFGTQRRPGQRARGRCWGWSWAPWAARWCPWSSSGSRCATLARLTPHAWAIDAFRDLVYSRAGLLEILAQLSVLVVYAGVLVALGTWGLRRSLTRG